MKLYNIFKGVVFGASLATFMGACTEPIQFGGSFIQKTPGGDATIDTVFGKAEYAERFLTTIYNKQYYGLPYASYATGSHSYWTGNFEIMSDCWHVGSNIKVAKMVYNGEMQASSENYVYCFEHEQIWEQVRAGYLLLENIDRVPDMDAQTKEQYKAEVKCLIASSYFNLLRFYGGLPIVRKSFEVNGDKLSVKRESLENTVNFIVGLFDEAAQSNALPWSYTEDEATSLTGHWTKAAAMAMKCKVLQYVASPLFNDDQPYYRGTYTMDDDSYLWWGGKKPELWQQCKQACEDFFRENANHGNPYHMVEPTEQTQEGYRYAYRHAYIDQSSPEVIFSTRVTSTNNNNNYVWYKGRSSNKSLSYQPTEEFQEMFPWADGKPFNWEETEAAGELDHMFIKGTFDATQQYLQNIQYTRDPRLYETMCVNGQRPKIQYSNGKTDGANIKEMWIGGSNAKTSPKDGSGFYGTGFFHNKYIADGDRDCDVYARKAPHWVVVRMADLYLTYAEALLQADGNNAEALKYVDKVRARVGLKGLAECNPTENLTTNKDNLLQEILRERACELGFENTRFFDMQRYKRADLFTRQLHALKITRLVQKDGQWVESTNQWWGSDKTKAKKYSPEWYEPSHFKYERAPITFQPRIWWTQGFDPKWYMLPFPQSEVIKGYLVQNPGW